MCDQERNRIVTAWREWEEDMQGEHISPSFRNFIILLNVRVRSSKPQRKNVEQDDFSLILLDCRELLQEFEFFFRHPRLGT